MLTEEQRAAVMDVESPRVACVSAAGTGKTRVLTERVRHLLNTGVSPYEIMLVTFTRKAAAEMLARLELTDTTTTGMIVGTFHSLALSIVRRDREVAGYLSGPQVLSPMRFDQLVRDVCESLGFRSKNTWRRITKTEIDRAFTEYYSTGNLGSIPEASPKAQRERRHVRAILQETLQRMRRMGVSSFGQIVVDAYGMITERDDIRDAWCSKVSHVLVDEVQDCDQLQWKVVHALRSEGKSLFVVGDREQSIYGWRGADPECLDVFANNCDRVYRVLKSFRCSPHICYVSNELRRDGCAMVSARESGAGVTTLIDRSETEPYSAVASNAKTMRIDGIPYEDQAVLARTNANLIALAEVFKQYGVPAHIVGSSYGIESDSSFQDVYALLCLAVNRDDDISFSRFAEVIGLKRVDVERVRAKAHHATSALWDAYVASLPDAKPHPLVDVVGSGDTANVCRFLDALAPIVSVSERASRFIRGFGRVMSVQGFLDWFAARESAEDVPPEGHVTLSTVHAAKGLEWRAVTIANCDESHFGGVRASQDESEERRVLYVAMTRASEFLFLHCRSGADAGFIGRLLS